MSIAAGSYRVAAEYQVNGVSYPCFTMSVEMNAYSFASTLDITGPIFALDANSKNVKAATADFNALSQHLPLVPLKVRLGYEDATKPQGPISLFDVEQGYIDESTYTYDANEIHIVGRSTASRFQDIRLAGPSSKNLRGDQLVSQLFGKAGLPVTIGGTSTTYLGKGYTPMEYVRSFRARSQWDEMTDAALKDGFVLYIHNGRGYYGPPALSPPTVYLNWGQDLIACAVNHAARRSHDISVTLDSYAKATQRKVTATYGSRAGSQGENFRFFITGLDQGQARAQAKAIWTDLVKREFIGTIKFVPDTAFLKILAANGPNFLVQLGGCLPAHNILYHVKKASLNVNAGDDEPSATVELVIENHAPVMGAGMYV